MNQPNPEKHQLVSFIKSFTRIVGYFLLFINKLAGVSVKTFPIVFNNGTFLGSYNETKDYVDKMNCFDANLNF
jgi:hypothetical protein